MIDSFIETVARGRSFLDVGPLWGQQKLSLAYHAGATRLTAIDIMPKDDPLWIKLATELGPLADKTEFICGDVCRLTGISYDVVYCAGVLYHHPDPLRFMQELHGLCNEYTVLGTTYTESVVENIYGRVEVAPGGALFLPAVPEKEMVVLREDWRGFLGGRPGDALSQPQANWDLHNLQHWWWLFTQEYVQRLCQLVGFQIEAYNVQGKIINLLLKKDK